MPSITEALALFDTANQVERLQFQLRDLPPAPAIPHLMRICAHVRTLAEITTAVGEEVNRRLANGPLSVGSAKAVQAYSDALAPLGETMTELGRVQAEIAFFNFTTHPAARDNAVVLAAAGQQAGEVITGCCEAADEILGTVAGELRVAATELAPPPTRAQATALARSPHTQGPGQSAAAPAVPAASALPAAAPTGAKGR
jgi:hypothetical protein